MTPISKAVNVVHYTKTVILFVSVLFFSYGNLYAAPSIIEGANKGNITPVSMPAMNSDLVHESPSHRVSNSKEYLIPRPSRNQSTDPGRSATVTPISSQLTSTIRADKLTVLIMRVQIALISEKFFEGGVDGVFESETRDAIQSFQARNGLTANGDITTETLNLLGVSALR